MFIERLPVVKTIKLLIAQTGSLQKLVDRPGITHEFCNEQAIKIMKQDGLEAYADILDTHKTELNWGVIWADRDWKNISHYYIPKSGGGLWRFSNATEDYQEYFQKAVLYARSSDYKMAAFYLGAAAHLVQDMCVPHHARGVLFKGHSQFESWAEKHREEYAVNDRGLYNSDNLLRNNALVSGDLFSQAAFGQINGYQQALKVLLPLSQRTTAGLFQYFFAVMRGKVIYKIVAA
ncbi:MAG: zinc dependent phospholipase C family protein [Pelosinus sp.]|nr:zinc dependent phospholipase C family protein [Pelosinus sp.]